MELTNSSNMQSVTPDILSCRKKYIIYTDGSGHPTRDRGGYGRVVVVNGQCVEKSSIGYKDTTSNRMEILGGLDFLESLEEPSEVLIYSDSQYTCNTVNTWMWKWELANFSGKKNVDLVKRFIIQCRKHRVTYQWVKGHNGNKFNEMCDQLATESRKLPINYLFQDNIQ